MEPAVRFGVFLGSSKMTPVFLGSGYLGEVSDPPLLKKMTPSKGFSGVDKLWLWVMGHSN